MAKFQQHPALPSRSTGYANAAFLSFGSWDDACRSWRQRHEGGSELAEASLLAQLPVFC